LWLKIRKNIWKPLIAALARALTQQGKKVRFLKTGPEFIDPQFLSIASGAPVYQLDLWMCGEAECQRLLFQAA
jgi:cobyrinic acid a,c-diamide synthase